MSNVKFQCGRRGTSLLSYQPNPAEPEDEYINGRCNYCGSASPEKLFEAIVEGLELTPTDKNYKIYIPGGKFYFQHFSSEDKDRFIAMVNAKEIKFGYPGYLYVLPYFMGLKGTMDDLRIPGTSSI